MMIKDLEMNKALSDKELAGVRGGNTNLALLYGPMQSAPSGFSFASPVIQVAPQVVTQTNTSVDIASVIASLNTGILQH